MKLKHRAVLCLLLVFVGGCASSRVSTPSALAPLAHAVNRVALAPSGGLLADAVGIEIFGQGITVIDTQETSSLLVRTGLTETEVMSPQSLSLLREQGIDAFLVVRSADGYDGRPQSATARAVSTHDGSLVAAVTWQNGRGGAAGSAADGMMRKDLTEAAQEIASALASQLLR